MSHYRTPALTVMILVLAACSGDGAAPIFSTPTTSTTVASAPVETTTTEDSTTASLPSTTTSLAVTTSSIFEPQPTDRVFRVVVIVDLSSEDVTFEQAEALIADASSIQEAISGFTVEMIDFVQATPELSPLTAEQMADYQTVETAQRNIDLLVADYASVHPNQLPDGFMILSYGTLGAARLFGGYTYTVPAPPNHDVRFNPEGVTEPIFHIGVVHVGHRYAACGYGPDPIDRGADLPLQGTSFGGECQNRDGVQCVQHNGYSMCVTALNDMYASTPTYFAAATVVHETMHNFGIDTATDHYGTQACTDAMAFSGSLREYAADSDALFEHYSGICPFVYDRFVESFVYRR